MSIAASTQTHKTYKEVYFQIETKLYFVDYNTAPEIER